MTILDRFKMHVSVDGIRAHEFDDDEENDKDGPTRITKCVEAVSDAFFEFKFCTETTFNFAKHRCDGLCYRVIIDGKKV
jgi:hypothetical protein